MKLFLTLLSSCTIVTSTFAVDISNLPACVTDIQQNGALPNTKQPYFTTNYQSVMMELQMMSVFNSLPAVYQKSMLTPFIAFMQSLGATNFQAIFGSAQPSPQNQYYKSVIPDVVEALLQVSDQDAAPTRAFQEMVNDLYAGFLSDENRVSKTTGMPIKPPDKGVIPPLVKWGNPQNGPYTWPVDATVGVKVAAGVVSLPPNNRLGGLLAWTALPHETAGHDIMHADTGLVQELGNLVNKALLAQLPNNPFLAYYWQQCIDETCADMGGLLNGGPAIGIGLVGYFRGLMGGALRCVGYLPPTDTHPIDILRAYLAARVVSQMPFAEAQDWAAAIKAEADKDLQQIYLYDPQSKQQIPLDQQAAIKSASIVADTIMNSKLMSLEGHALKEIQIWNDDDQSKAVTLGLSMAMGLPLPDDFKNNGYYAAHVVAGATFEALKAGANIPVLFTQMINYLDVMHQYDTTWNTTPPVPPPAPVPTPTPVPTDECACLCACYQKCKSQATPSSARAHQATAASEELMSIK